ncbi:MAG: hypothetical protein QM783_17375 [Phycisphaerales bacterium]
MSQPLAIKKIGRKRRAAGWTLLAFGVLLGTLWLASGWWRIGRINTRSIVDIENGRLNYSSFASWNETERRGFFRLSLAEAEQEGWGRRGFSLRAENLSNSGWPDHDLWLVSWCDEPGRLVQASIAWWPLPAALLAVSVPFLRSGLIARRRSRSNACPTCGYSFAGLEPGAPCPECGR